MVVVVNGDIGHVVVIVNIAAIKVVAVGYDVVVIVAGEIGNVDGVLVVVIIVIVAFVTVVIVVIIIIVIVIIVAVTVYGVFTTSSLLLPVTLATLMAF